MKFRLAIVATIVMLLTTMFIVMTVRNDVFHGEPVIGLWIIDHVGLWCGLLILILIVLVTFLTPMP